MAKRITGPAMLAASGVTTLVAAIGVAALTAATPANAQDKVVYINSSGGVLDDINRKINGIHSRRRPGSRSSPARRLTTPS